MAFNAQEGTMLSFSRGIRRWRRHWRVTQAQVVDFRIGGSL